MRKTITSEQFQEAYGSLTATPDQLTDKQKDNRNVISKVGSKYSGLLTDDELKSCGLNALWRCLSYHEDGRGKKFTTSLWTFLEWEYRRELKKKKQKTVKTVSLSDHDFPLSVSNEDCLALKECIEMLDPDHKLLINQYYSENRTMEEIGRINGYSKEAARQKINKAVSQLRELYLKES
jgi:hypothetical protein